MRFASRPARARFAPGPARWIDCIEFAPSLTFSKLRSVAGEPSAHTETSAGTKYCPHFHAAIEMIGKRWSGAIVSALSDGPCRFGELSQAVPKMSDRLLSQRLRELEAEGVVERTVEPEAPPRVTYSLTRKGADLDPALRELEAWGQRWNT
jgi:DNA-binding HxlR family transcriptional regulator